MNPPAWINYPALAPAPRGGLYQDILSHCRERLHYPARHTTAHESAHLIHSDIRNQLGQGFRSGGFYVGQDRALLLRTQPRYRKSAVAAVVPAVLRERNYGVYVTGAREWDDSPLYLYDEWVCYILGGQVAVEQVRAGEYQEGWAGAMIGLLEFSAYALAVVQVTQRLDPGYLTREPQFLPFTAYCLRWAADVYGQGSLLPQFRWSRQDHYLAALRQNPAAGPMRQLLQRQFGGSWLIPPPGPEPPLDLMLL